MKELSIEEKAKRYDEILARAEGANLPYYNDDIMSKVKEFVEYLLPELKESEDEKIWIINYLNNRILNSTIIAEKDNLKKAIAWLEKQGEQKPTISYDALREGIGHYGITQYQIDYWLKKYVDVEKQGEQKPTDKVEPKFKVGDWVIDKQGIVHQIANVIENVTYHTYGYDIVGGGYFNDNTEGVRLWTIQDAKDGDILCTYECDEPKIVFILKGTPKKHYALSYHCYYNIMYPHFASDSEKGCLAPNDEDVKPATQEQRDLLFKKMKEAGYEWEKAKQLKKIEQKPAWSEEDRKIIIELIGIFESAVDGGYVDIPYRLLKDYIRVLKSCLPQNTWKPSEEMLEALYRAVHKNVKEMSEDEILLDKLYQGLKYGRVL